ncbi:hypothetical protein SpCBS45565_g08104 [Spizellomyces sp. 'palustris']|nr:hypothetical protein SpCBS45565_g08104 [Spizellomyces sp. 'palustris']
MSHRGSVDYASASSDPTKSVDNSGQPSSGNVWSWSKAIKGIKRGRLPIVLVLILFLVPVSAGVALVAWALTYNAALVSASTLAGSLQAGLLASISSDVLERVHDIERSTEVHVRNWAHGSYKMDNYALKEETLIFLINTLLPNDDSYISQYFITYPGGELWGAVVYRNADGSKFHQIARSHGHNATWWTMDPANITNQVMYANFTADYSSLPWFEAIDHNTPDSAAWMNATVITDAGIAQGWLTFGRAIHSPTNAFLGMQNCDLTLDFLSMSFNESTSNIPYNGWVYGFELHPTFDVVVGSTADANLFHIASDGSYDRLLYLNELATNVTSHEAMGAFYLHLLRESNGSLYQYVTNPHPSSILLSLSSGTFAVQIQELRSRNLHWAIIYFVSKDEILAGLHQSNRKTIATVVGVVLAGCFVGIVFAYFLSKALQLITRDLRLLAEFKFKEVLQKDLSKESGIRQPTYSWITEL